MNKLLYLLFAVVLFASCESFNKEDYNDKVDYSLVAQHSKYNL